MKSWEELGYEARLIKYRILPKISPFPSLTSKFLHRHFYLVISPRPYAAKKCTISKIEHLAIDKNTVIRSLNSLSSSLISPFC